MVHENGCRAPPWRQLHGEIAYFVMGSHKAQKEISVTASTYGWFINEGISEKTGDINFERSGEIYRDLVSLLRAEFESIDAFFNNPCNINILKNLKSDITQLKSQQKHSKQPLRNEKRINKNLSPKDGSTHNDSAMKKTGREVNNEEKQTGLRHPSQKWQVIGLKSTNRDVKRLNTRPSGDQGQNKENTTKLRSKSQQKSRSKVSPKNKKSNASKSDNEWLVLDSNNNIDQVNCNWMENDWAFDGTAPVGIDVSSLDSAMCGSLTMNQNRCGQDLKGKTTIPQNLSGREMSSETESDENGDTEAEDEEEEVPERRTDAGADLPSEYWQIGKMVKYLKGGNQTSTIISLCALQDMPLKTEVCQLAVRDVGGLDVLINLLETDEVRCKLGALKILKEITRNPQIRRAIADIGGIQPLVSLLRSPNRDLKCLTAEVIANVANFHRSRRTVRQYGGIKRLVALLDTVSFNNSLMSPDAERDIEVARCGALALWSCSRSRKNKLAMKKAGIISLLAKLLKSPHENMLIPVVGTLEECATEATYRTAIRTEGMIEDLVKNLKRENPELQMHCASTIHKCAEDAETRDLVRQYSGLQPITALLDNQENKELLAAATGAMWKCCISRENVKQFQKLGAIEKLVGLLNNQPEEVLVNVVGALGEIANDTNNRVLIRKAGGIGPLVSLLTRTNQSLLINTTRAVGKCAEEPESMSIIEGLDGVRLLWSLLKNQNPEVQANAAWALCPCIENAKDAGEMVRSFVGGLELIVSLLKSEDRSVLAAVCAAVSKIATDEENLAVITDHGVVPLLSRLTNTVDDKLRSSLTDAIAQCCTWGTNRIDFGVAGAVRPLVDYLHTSDPEVHRSTARALFQLSRDPNNCVVMHEAGVVNLLLQMVGSADIELQNAAAGCISNIRRLTLAHERAELQRKHEKRVTSKTKSKSGRGKVKQSKIKVADDVEDEEESTVDGDISPDMVINVTASENDVDNLEDRPEDVINLPSLASPPAELTAEESDVGEEPKEGVEIQS